MADRYLFYGARVSFFSVRCALLAKELPFCEVVRDGGSWRVDGETLQLGAPEPIR